MKKYHLDLSNIKTRDDLHKLLKNILPLPEHYGDNLDALNDALWDMGDDWDIEITGIESVPEDISGYIDTMCEVFESHIHRMEKALATKDMEADKKLDNDLCEVDLEAAPDFDRDLEADPWDYAEIDKPPVFGILMAAGKGSRIGGDIPKQFVPVKGKPLFIRTLQNMLTYRGFERVIVAAPKEWEGYTIKLVEEYLKEDKAALELVEVASGGDTRLESLTKALKYIEECYGMDSEIIAVTHDAARPFVTSEMIESSVDCALRFGASTAAIPATDTIAMDENDDWEYMDIKMIENIPSRSSFLQIQTPQSFDIGAYLECLEAIEEKEFITDAAGVFTLAGRAVAVSLGDRKNIKITYPEDFRIAEAMIED